MNPKVSIVIPVYNGSNYLKEAIDSALAQTYENIEIIVVDDGSNDVGATERIAKSYGNKIKYYYKENGGVATALNLGIKKMTGEYFSWLSHDDMYEKTKIKAQVDYFKKQKRRNIVVASNVKTLFDSGIKKKEKIDKATFKFIDIFLATSAIVGVNGCSLLIPKQAFEECGVFNEKMPVTQDYDLWFRMRDKYGFELLDKYLVISRRHAGQDSVTNQEMLVAAGDRMHSKFLTATSYDRFEEYFKENRKNLAHAYENYKIYKLRGYKKTSSMLLKNLLRYYYENDKTNFYRLFNSEIRISDDTRLDHSLIEQEYEKLLKSGAKEYPIKGNAIQQDKPLPKNKLFRAARNLSGSVSRDGLYLTGEKIARRVISKASKK